MMSHCEKGLDRISFTCVVRLIYICSILKEFDRLGEIHFLRFTSCQCFGEGAGVAPKRKQPLSCEENLHSSVMAPGATVICVQILSLTLHF